MKHSNLIFQQLFEKGSSTYTYLLGDTSTREAIFIDSVLETVDRDLKLVQELNLKLQFVLDTHVHADHVTGAGEIRNRLGVKTAVAKKANIPCGDIKLGEGDELKFGSFSIRTIETPGHTDSSLSFVCEGMVFTGDALLIRGCGRTDFQGGSSERLFESVKHKLFTLPPETLVYPAHDYNGFTSSTIQAEIEHNPRLGQGRSKSQFREIMANLKLAYPEKIDLALPANQSCGQTIPVVTAEDLHLRERKSLLVDVRGVDEFNGELGHISGAHLITLGDNLKHFLEGYDRAEEIIFVCRSGKRSVEAAKLGLELGFQKVFSLTGGMQRWLECGFPVERGGKN